MPIYCLNIVNGQAMRAAGRAAVRLAAVAYRPNVMASGYAQAGQWIAWIVKSGHKLMG